MSPVSKVRTDPDCDHTVSRTGNPQHLTVPDNVKQADNYYQRNGGPFSGGSLTNPSANHVDHNLTKKGVNHNTIVEQVFKRPVQ